MKKYKFYLCQHCGNLVQMLNNVGEIFTCCNSYMILQIPRLEKITNDNYSFINQCVEIKLDSLIDDTCKSAFVFLQTTNQIIKRKIDLQSTKILSYNLQSKELPLLLTIYTSSTGLIEYEIKPQANDLDFIPGWFHKESLFSLEIAKTIANKLNIDFEQVNFTINDFLFGMTIELEHGYVYGITNVSNDDALLTAKIALAHLNENSFYYNKKIGLTAWKSAINGIKENPNLKKIEIK